MQDLESDPVPGPGATLDAWGRTRDPLVREYLPRGPPPCEVAVATRVVRVRVADHDGIDAPSPAPREIGVDDVGGVSGSGVVDEHPIPGLDHYRETVTDVEERGPHRPRVRNRRRPPQQGREPQRARPAARQAGRREQDHGAGHREGGGRERRLHEEGVPRPVRGQELEQSPEGLERAGTRPHQQLPRRVRERSRERQAKTPGEKGRQHGDAHEGDRNRVRDRPRDRLLGEPMQDEGRETHRDDDLGYPPAAPVEDRGPRVRSPAHSVDEHGDGAERQPEPRGEHGLRFQDQDRHQSETQDGAPGQPPADAERAEQHDGHDERSPGRERESGERRVAGGHRHAGERADTHRRHPGDEPRPRHSSGEEPEAAGKSDVQARDCEEMRGAGSAEDLPLAAVNAVAHSHHERFDQCSLRADPRRLAQPPGKRVPDPSRVEPAGGGEPPISGVLGPHVPLARVAVPKQPGLVVETARVAESSRGPKPDHESPGLTGDDFRRIPSGVCVPRETQAAFPVREPVLHEKVEPGTARGGGRNGGDPPRHD